jgi:hypothetical protein
LLSLMNKRWKRGDTTASQGKREGSTTRGNVTTSQCIERQWLGEG